MKPIEIVLKPPRWFTQGLILMHVLALLVIVFTSFNQAIPKWVTAVLFVLVLVSLMTGLLRARLAEFDGLQVNANGVLTLHRQGEWQQAEVMPASVVTTLLVLLYLRVEGRVKYQLVFPQVAGDEAFRQLRVWLKWGRQ